MPPPAILDPAAIDLERVLWDRSRIDAILPHRFEFGLVDAVLLADTATGIYAGYYDATPDAWWVRGHIPGRPLLPGVLMIEIAAQLSSIMYHAFVGGNRFMGFAGVDDVKFRGVVEPPARLLVVGRSIEAKPRRMICDTQGFVNGTMVFEARITGMPI